MDYLSSFAGSKTILNSRTWGKLIIESASFTPAADGDLVVQIGNPFEVPIPLIRIHSECVFAEVFDSDFCDCADQFYLAMQRLKEEGNGILFYLRFDGRGAGLAAKVAATALEIDGMDTYQSRISIGVLPEGRDFSKISQYLIDKGITSVRLLTNNPTKGEFMEKNGILVKYEPILVENPNENIRKLYKTKEEKFGHLIPKELT